MLQIMFAISLENTSIYFNYDCDTSIFIHSLSRHLQLKKGKMLGWITIILLHFDSQLRKPV